MIKEDKLNLNAGNYAICHCIIDHTYNGLEVHKMLCDAYIAGNNDNLDDVSEDEKIRKALIRNFTNQHSNNFPTADGFTREQILSWLERQGEHANFRDKIQVGDKVTRNEACVLVNLSQLNRIAKKNEKQDEHAIYNVPSREVILAIWDLGNEWKELTNGCISTKYGTQLDYIQKHWNESEYYLKEKQAEQKTTNKVEPKSNFVVNDIDVDKTVGRDIKDYL